MKAVGHEAGQRVDGVVELGRKARVPRLQMYLDVLGSVQLLWLRAFCGLREVQIRTVLVASGLGVDFAEQGPTRCGITRLFQHFTLHSCKWIFGGVDRAGR